MLLLSKKYELIKASKEHIELLIKYKLDTIFEFADSISLDEQEKINNYVLSEVPKMLGSYHMILNDNEIIGAYCVTSYEDGILLDEIYIEEGYRSKGIGSSIIKEVLNRNNIVYLWVYKLNVHAIKLYENLGFKIVNETETRYFMKASK